MDKTFYYDDKTKKVIAKLSKNSVKGIWDELCERTTDEKILNLFEELIRDNNIDIYQGNGEFTGKASCDECDTYNREIGERIAARKADYKYHKSMAKKYLIMKKLLKRAIDEVSALNLKHEVKANNIRESIEREYINRE